MTDSIDPVRPYGMDKNWLQGKFATLERGEKQALAEHVGVSPSVLSKLVHTPRAIKSDEADKIREFFARRDGQEPSSGGNDLHSQTVKTVDHRPPSQHSLRSKAELAPIKVLGIAVGGAGGDFYMNGDTNDYVRRPVELADRQGIFALWVRGNSMEPRYFEGELLYLDAIRPPRIGDFVVVELRPTGPTIEMPAFLKRLAARDGKKIKLEQYQPAKVLEFPMEKVHRVLRVMTMQEVFGGPFT